MGDVSSCSSLEELHRHIVEYTANLAFWPLRMDFDAKGSLKTCYFERRCLGMEFSKSAPFVVERFKGDSYAQACGVERGWVLLRVGDLVVASGATFEFLMES